MVNPQSFKLPMEFLIVGAAAETGLLEALKQKPAKLDDLAQSLQLDERALWTVAEALKALGYLEESKGLWQLSPEADDLFFNPQAKDYLGFSFLHTYHITKAWTELPQVMQSGQPLPKSNPQSHSKSFVQAMSHVAREAAQQIVEFCCQDFASPIKVLDVGGGPLTNALAFRERGAEVVVLDLPGVIEMMAPQAPAGIEMIAGDFNQGLPNGSYDLIYLGNVCHIYGEKENCRLFQAAAKQLKPGGQLVISDFIRGEGEFASLFGVNMLVNTQNGGTWTFAQYAEWLEKAGLKAQPWQEVAQRQLIKAWKP